MSAGGEEEKATAPQVHHLYGPASQQLCSTINSGVNDFEKYKMILDFLYLYDGQGEFWDLLKFGAQASHESGDVGSRVQHVSDIAAAHEAKANELLTVSGFTMLGTVMMKKRDRQIQAAKAFFKLGKYK